MSSTGSPQHKAGNNSVVHAMQINMKSALTENTIIGYQGWPPADVHANHIQSSEMRPEKKHCSLRHQTTCIFLGQHVGQHGHDACSLLVICCQLAKEQKRACEVLGKASPSADAGHLGLYSE